MVWKKLKPKNSHLSMEADSCLVKPPEESADWANIVTAAMDHEVAAAAKLCPDSWLTTNYEEMSF